MDTWEITVRSGTVLCTPCRQGLESSWRDRGDGGEGFTEPWCLWCLQEVSPL